MTDRAPRVADPAELDWSSWGERSATRGRVEWKNLIDGDRMLSEDISLGVSRIGPGE